MCLIEVLPRSNIGQRDRILLKTLVYSSKTPSYNPRQSYYIMGHLPGARHPPLLPSNYVAVASYLAISLAALRQSVN